MTAFDTLVSKENNINLAAVIEVRVSEQVAKDRIISSISKLRVSHDSCRI